MNVNPQLAEHISAIRQDLDDRDTNLRAIRGDDFANLVHFFVRMFSFVGLQTSSLADARRNSPQTTESVLIDRMGDLIAKMLFGEVVEAAVKLSGLTKEQTEEAMELAKGQMDMLMTQAKHAHEITKQ